MRRTTIYGLLAAAIVLPVACTQSNGTATLTPQAQSAIAKLCQQDAVLQPVAAGAAAGVGVVAGAGSPVAGVAIASGVQVDQSVLHPLVQDACAKLPPAAAAAPAKS